MDYAHLVDLENVYLEEQKALESKYAQIDNQFVLEQITEKQRDDKYERVDLEIENLDIEYNIRWLEKAIERSDPPTLNPDKVKALINKKTSLSHDTDKIELELDGLEEDEIEEEGDGSLEPVFGSNISVPLSRYGRSNPNPFESKSADPFISDFTPRLKDLFPEARDPLADADFIKANKKKHDEIHMIQERHIRACEGRVCSLCFYHSNYFSMKISTESPEEYDRRHPHRSDATFKCSKTRTCDRIWHRECIVDMAPYVPLSEIPNGPPEENKEWKCPKCVYGLDMLKYHLKNPGIEREAEPEPALVPASDETVSTVISDSKEKKVEPIDLSDSKEEKKVRTQLSSKDEPILVQDSDSDHEWEIEAFMDTYTGPNPNPEPEPDSDSDSDPDSMDRFIAVADDCVITGEDEPVGGD